MAVLVTPQLPLPVEAAAVEVTQMAVSVEVHLVRLLINRVLSPQAVVRLLEVLLASVAPTVVLMVATLLADKVGLPVVHIQVLELVVATSVVEVAATDQAYTYKGRQAGLGILTHL
jgi:hypothetical protein